ncbi:hypothetical protein [Bradyrhizobium sp. WSM3983]|uniref:hypothetical protein n=1 Tax=Bradyrhizobium sp. WSM3983 TaxID=1038867 RepID=UPI000486A177|nr:hypothetical protein [Bradyrhizobium sp. WSM3983]
MSEKPRVAGRAAIGTVTARGTGESIAELFVSEGAKVLLVNVNPDVEDTARHFGQAAIVKSVTNTDAGTRSLLQH